MVDQIQDLENKITDLEQNLENEIINSVDLQEKNNELKDEIAEIKEENQKLQQQIVKTEESALNLIDSIHEEVEEKENEELQCEYNTNGSCIFYDTMSSIILNCIDELEEIRQKNHDFDLYNELQDVIEKLDSVLERG